MQTELLFLVAEIGAAFAGFATLVAVVSDRSGRSPDQVRFRFRLLQNALVSSLLTVAFAILPAVVAEQDIDPSVALRGSAGACFVILSAYIAYILPRLLRNFRAAAQPIPANFVAATLASLAIDLIFAACALGVLPTSAYYIANSGLLFIAGVAFLRFFLLLGREVDPD